MTDTLILVDNASKKFCRSLKRSLWYGMKDLGNELLGRRHGGKGELRKDEFWAVKDVSLEVKRGECLGLIGRNGAGKTTLLRMLNGLIKPDSGSIEIHGRVGALIALGAGFNPLLTGRENIFVNAAILGFGRDEVKARMGDIIEFAELGEFIDSPVQQYSSGMFVRLGFAVAANFDPDILLVDEALAVGDLAFTVKCLNRIAELRRSGTCVIFVSHNELQIREAADRCMLLDRGRGAAFASIEAAFRAYGRLSDASVPIDPDTGFIHNGPVRVRYAGCSTEAHQGMLRSGRSAVLSLECISESALEHADLELRFWSSSGQLMTIIRSSLADQYFNLPKGESMFQIAIQTVALAPGRYRLAAGFRRHGEVLGWSRDLAHVDVEPPVGKSPVDGTVYHDATISGPLPAGAGIQYV